jgi:predicted nucleotidyltransferase
MLTEFTTLSPFLEDPARVYSAREIAKLTDSNHITVSKKVQTYPFMTRAKNGPYLGFKVENTAEFKRLRLLYNLQKIWNSGLVEELNKLYDYPTVVLFGSFSTADQVKTSDVDVCVISPNTKEYTLETIRKKLGHNVQLFIKTKKQLQKMHTDNPQLLNSICNGIVLSGELEVFK